MSRFGKKLIIWLVVTILVLGSVSLAVTTIGLDKYYLAIKKVELHQTYEELSSLPIHTIYENTHALGKKYNIVLLTIKWDKDGDVINDRLAKAFIKQGVSLQKLWLWEEDAKKLEEGKVVNQLYNQGSSGYSLFIKYYLQDNQLVVMSYVIPHIDEIVRIINLFIIGVWLFALGILVVCITFYIRRMTQPLLAMEHMIEDVSKLRFGQVQVKTGDELESLASGMNKMSERLQIAHGQLEDKNKQMKEFLANVSHELKTPIALIKAYGIAIQDGMDDGTFLDTILQQNEVIEKMVEKLLMLAKKEQQESSYTRVNLNELIQNHIENYNIYKNQVNIRVKLEKVEPIICDAETISCAIGNFISNAIKYTADGKVEVRCYQKDTYVHIEVRNGITENGKAVRDHLWDPFYVAEDSRNKALCGTGLGLYITHQLLEKEKIVHGSYLEENTIVFYMMLEKKLI